MVEDAPLTMVAVTTTVPVAVGVRVLPPVKFARPLFNVHTMFLFVALEGTTVPDSISAVPTVAVSGTPVISVTATKAGVAAPVEGNRAVTTPLLAGLVADVAPATVKKFCATPVSVKPVLGVRVMVAV